MRTRPTIVLLAERRPGLLVTLMAQYVGAGPSGNSPAKRPAEVQVV